MLTKTSIIATGLSGMVGTRIEQLLSDTFDFEDISRRTGIDITDENLVFDRIASSRAPIIIHLAAKTDVDACEDDKILGEEGQAWQVNVFGTENVVTAARKSGKKIIYISTEFVFDGTKEYYEEEDIPNPVNWYGETKYQGEQKVIGGGVDYIILRICHPYSAVILPKKDFVHRLIERFNNHQNILAVSDFFFTPTYIDDIAITLKSLLAHNLSGIYHLGGSQKLTPIEACTIIADTLSFNKNLIIPTTREEFFRGRAFRPFKLALKNDKIAKLKIYPRSFADGMKEFKNI